MLEVNFFHFYYEELACTCTRVMIGSPFLLQGKIQGKPQGKHILNLEWDPIKK